MSTWNVDQYQKFREERSQPAYDLMDLIGPRNSMRIIDLGCGAGDITKTLHERYRAAETIGVDSSETMLAKAPRLPGLSFIQGDIRDYQADMAFDLVFSNAALQWVPDHETLFGNLYRMLRPGGQMAIQIPKNGDHPSQRVAYALEKEPPYDRYLPNPLEKNTLAIEDYASLLHRIGFKSIKVRMYVYLHTLPSSEGAVEFMKGSLLTHYAAMMPAEVYGEFEAEYRKRVVATLGPAEPFLYTFKRILMHAVR